MFKPRKQVWRDNTEPPKNYIWEKLNESGSYIGTFEFNGERWVKIKDSNPSGGSGCSCDGKYVPLTNKPKIVYGTDENGKEKVISYSEDPMAQSIAFRMQDGRLKSSNAKEKDDVVTLTDICWNE